MEKWRKEFSSLVNAIDLYDWSHGPQTENPLSVPLILLMVLFSSDKPVKTNKIKGDNSYIFQSHDLLTKMTAGHCNFIFL